MHNVYIGKVLGYFNVAYYCVLNTGVVFLKYVSQHVTMLYM